jgi:hypothetical protein
MNLETPSAPDATPADRAFARLGQGEAYRPVQFRALVTMGARGKRLLLITGASTGIGAATARAGAGSHRLVLAARRAEAVE